MSSSTALVARGPTRSRLLALVGATATGKTAAAVRICRRLNGEIVGADSVQIYRGLDIGSAKPTPAELDSVPHHMLDLLDPNETMDAVRFAKLADETIQAIGTRGRIPVLVGGTGLWIRALLRGLVALPPADRQLREQLWRKWGELGAATMHRRLALHDPLTAARVHANDRKRVVRALEVLEQTGRPLGELQAAHAQGTPRYDATVVLLGMPTAHLNERIRVRTRTMIDRGWIEEARTIAQRYGPDSPALRSLGYRQVMLHLDGKLDLARMQAAIVQATKRYAKRQRTWFNSDPDVGMKCTPEELLGEELLARFFGSWG
ncbi:MAG: tRNA (adenosine(37)-N6)-dimethylallyltransferase MiaA [Proteobacteria bacterium]|nr:tRNA (adenosine(37)-N6)-dimethylallyltransferase MiaA [Pseudomonadota bacterium]